MRPHPPSGVLVLDKPRGPTSHDVVARVRRALRTREVGHAGTLDPMATGILVVAIGEATKLVRWLTCQEKVYEATIALGIETDTLDAEGVEIRRAPLPAALAHALAHPLGLPTSPMILAALEVERTRRSQVPPAFSAVQQDGVRAYTRARRGEEVHLEPRDIRVHALELLASSDAPPWLAVRVEVDKGYYVRSLARDLARGLSTVGHLTTLRRIRSGSFALGEAVPLTASDEELSARVQPLADAAARALPVAHLSEAGARDARHGRLVQSQDIDAQAPGAYAWLGPDRELIAVGDVDAGGRGSVLRGFRPVDGGASD